jgi:hypothetical protein
MKTNIIKPIYIKTVIGYMSLYLNEKSKKIFDNVFDDIINGNIIPYQSNNMRNLYNIKLFYVNKYTGKIVLEKYKQNIEKIQNNELIPYQTSNMSRSGYILFLTIGIHENNTYLKNKDNIKYKLIYQYPHMKLTGDLMFLNVNDKYKDLYNKYETQIKDGNLIPYQTIIMKHYGDLRLITKENYKLATISINKFNAKVLNNFTNYTAEIGSYSDFYKMNRTGNDVKYNYKYLNEICNDVEESKHLNNFIEKNMCDTENILPTNIFNIEGFANNRPVMFVPYLQNNKTFHKIRISEHNKYENINILGDIEFIDNLNKSDILKGEKGQILYELNKVLSSYNTNKLFNNNDSRKLNQQLLYGISKNDIGKIIYNKNKIIYDYITKYCKNRKCNYNESYDCEKIGDTILELYEKLDTLNFDDNKFAVFVDKKLECVINRYNLDKLYDKSIGIYLDNNYINIFDKCYKYRFSLEDAHTDATINGCDELLTNNIISDKKLLEKLKTIKENYMKYSNKDTDTMLGLLYVGNTPLNKYNFKLYEEYMPEWMHYIMNNQSLQDIFNYRQLFLGEYKLTERLQKCSLFVKSDPFVAPPLEINGIGWDISINKILIGCYINNNIIFPIRIIKNIENIDLHYCYNNDDNNLFLLGTIIIKNRTDNKFNKKMFKIYKIYVFYDKTNRIIKLFSFRGNEIMLGNIYEHIRILYIELNVIQNSYIDIGIQCYIYKLNDTTYFVSRYKPNELYNKYDKIGIYKKETIDNIIKKLVCYKLEKDYNKRFILIPFNN